MRNVLPRQSYALTGDWHALYFVHMDEKKVITKLIEHDASLDRIERNMATKDDVRDMKDVLESIVTIAKKIQEDHVFAVEWLKRLQDHVERQDEEIRQIKLKLQMA